MNFFIILRFLILSLLMQYSLLAVRSIEELGDFYGATNKDLVVVHFYKLDKVIKKDKALYNQSRQETAVFKAAEKMEKMVLFVKVNLSESHLKSLEAELNIKSVPIFILFSYGQVIAILADLKPEEITAKNIQTFIRDNFAKEITAKLQFIAQERQRQEIERENQPSVYFYYGYGPYGYPWWYDPYYSPGYWGPSYRSWYHHGHGGHRHGGGGHHRR